MRSKLLNQLAPALAFLALSIFLWAYFGDLVRCPNCYLFSDNADGLKNYFTPAYSVKHDDGLWFGGMNYPYGEHPVYTDNQPAVSATLKLLDNLFPVADHVPGILHMLMLLSLLVAAACIYHLLRLWGLPRGYSALVSLPVVLLSPQIARFPAHYSLAYVCYLPVFLVLFAHWLRSFGSVRKHWILTGSLVVWIYWMGFTHLYYFFISCTFMLCFAFVHLVMRGFRPESIVWRTIVVSLLSAALVYGTVKLTDPVRDRPEEAWGVFVYNATAKGIYLPWYEPLASVWRDKYGITPPNVENTSYLGVLPVMMFPFVVAWMLVLFWRRGRWSLRRKSRDHWSRGQPFHPIFPALAAMLLWFIAAAWFYDIGNGILLEKFPILTQFRSLGRLAWLIYYVLAPVTAWLAYYGVRSIRRRSAVAGRIITAALAVLLILWVFESQYAFRKTVSSKMVSNTILGDGKVYSNLLSEQGYLIDDFQAILVLPLTAIGSEKLQQTRGLWWLRWGIQCSWETGLPIIDINMSRTSLRQTCSLLQMLSDQWIEKERLDHMDDRSILLLAPRDEKLIPSEERIVQLGDSIGAIDNIRVFHLPVQALKQHSTRPPDYQVIAAISYDGNATERSLAGQGALLTTEAEQPLLSFVDTFKVAGTLDYSGWSYLGPQTPVFAAVRHRVIDKDGKEMLSRDFSMFNYSPHNVTGNWVETSFSIDVGSTGYRHEISVSPPGSWIDEVVLSRVQDSTAVEDVQIMD